MTNNNATGSTDDGASRNKKAKKTIDLGWSKKDGHLDDLIESSSDEEDNHDGKKRRLQEESEEDEEEDETLDAKKIRLARQYLKKIESDDEDESSGSEKDDDDEEGEEDDDHHDRLGRKLQRKRMKRQGTLEYSVANRLAQDIAALHLSTTSATAEVAMTAATDHDLAFQHAKAWQDAGHVQYFRGHDLTPTCVALQQITGEKAISGAKDHSVWCWNVETGQKISQLCPTWKPTSATSSTTNNSAASRNAGQVLAVACSDDGRYAAVGKRDATVAIYDLRIATSSAKQQQPSVVTTFSGHKGAVTCLAFRTQSRQLFSGSEDRCIR